MRRDAMTSCGACSQQAAARRAHERSHGDVRVRGSPLVTVKATTVSGESHQVAEYALFFLLLALPRHTRHQQLTPVCTVRPTMICIALEYEQGGKLKTRCVDLLDLGPQSDVEQVIHKIQEVEPLVTASRLDSVRSIVHRLQEKQAKGPWNKVQIEKVLPVHRLPLTNVEFDKPGVRFLTGSYDRTCKVWSTSRGEEELSLEGHRNVVYAVAFNNPFRDKIATGSFDKTCRVWIAHNGQCLHTLHGHTAEIMCLQFGPRGRLLATGSLDCTARLWDAEHGDMLTLFKGHTEEIICLNFSTDGRVLLTASLDRTVSLWDVNTGRRRHNLVGHSGEVNSAKLSWDGSLAVSASVDKTAKLWDVGSGKCVATLTGHTDEVLDICFDSSGKHVATASMDGTVRIFDTIQHRCLTVLEGHEAEISKVSQYVQNIQCTVV
uniref:Dynein assembly factor with WDR repeat domains 1 n=1 Tax=Eptatretus burgeri TaxID=7764 RepID=A0A8C4QDX8_EPTBU